MPTLQEDNMIFHALPFRLVCKLHNYIYEQVVRKVFIYFYLQIEPLEYVDSDWTPQH